MGLVAGGQQVRHRTAGAVLPVAQETRGTLVRMDDDAFAVEDHHTVRGELHQPGERAGKAAVPDAVDALDRTIACHGHSSSIRKQPLSGL